MAQENENSTAAEENELLRTGSITAENSHESFYCLSVIGQIEGHYALDGSQKATKYDHILPLLCALEEMIASLSKPTASIVLGGGHSIGVPLAVSAKRSFIVPSATMTVHPVRTNGVVLGVPQAFDYLEKMQDRIVKFIVDHSSVEESYLRKLLHRTDVLVNDIGSILNGYEATACGLIDEVGGVKEALAALRGMAFGENAKAH